MVNANVVFLDVAKFSSIVVVLFYTSTRTISGFLLQDSEQYSSQLSSSMSVVTPQEF